MNPLIEARSIVKQFVGHRALDHVSLSVPEGSIFGLLGPNGAGKTTLIRIINQITAPDEGQILFRGEKLRTKHIEHIGYLPEERGLYRKMKVGEQALYLAQLKGLDKRLAHKRLREWFEKFDIMSWWNRKVEELSKGMQQKVQFVVTVVHNPDLLIFDEPFSGFDPINVNLLTDEILRLREDGSTIVFSTHNMASVEELCDHIALIHDSRTILEGKVSEIKREHKTSTFEVVYRSLHNPIGDVLNGGYEIEHQSAENDLHTARVKFDSGHSPNRLLETLLPHAEIVSFREILPSMNEIFISRVGEYTNGSNQERNG